MFFQPQHQHGPKADDLGYARGKEHEGGFFRIFRLFRTGRKRHPVPMPLSQLIQLRRTKRNDFDKVPQL